jgi:predicted phosphodiesterase
VKRIGLLSDNHGRLRVLKRAIGALRRRGADQLIHLGDFCDSLHRRDPAAIVRVLKENGVLAVMGNNDYIVEKRLALKNGRDREVSAGVRAYLGDLPVRIVNGDLCFAHSLPFDSIRSLYEPVDDGTTVKAAEIFSRTEHRILFCGHSHLSVLFRFSGDRLSREPLPDRRPLELDPSERFIIVVGALELGCCALYDRQKGVYETVRIF